MKGEYKMNILTNLCPNWKKLLPFWILFGGLAIQLNIATYWLNSINDNKQVEEIK